MDLSRCSAVMLACLLAAATGPLAAQAPAPAAPKDTKDAKAEADAAAMDRARRLAANPMRVILEASRVRRRADAELLPVAAVVPVTAAAPAAAAVPAGEVTPRTVPPPPRETAVPEPAIISSDLVQARGAAAPTPALALEPMAQTVTAPPAALAPMAALAPELARPTLINRVDPDPPPRLLVDLVANTVITADLTIKPDGSVSQVVLVTPNTRSLGRYVLAALQQWRYAPLPGERVWRVDLIFRADE